MTITVRLNQQLEANLRARLDAEGTELSEFVRQAIAEKLERDDAAVKNRKSAYEFDMHVFGKRGSRRSDLSDNAEQILREKLRAKHDGP